MAGKSRSRVRLTVVSAETPSQQSPSGFAARLYHFLGAAREHMEVTLALIELSTHGEVGSLPVDRVEVIPAPRSGWREPGRKGQLLRALVQYPLDPLPYHCYPRRLPALSALLRQEQPDVVVLYLPYLAQLIDHCPPGAAAIVALEEPWEWVVAAALGDATAKDRWLAQRESRRFERLYRRLSPRIEAAVAISEAEAQYFGQTITPGKISVIPHGIDTRYFRSRESPRRDIDVLVVGRLRVVYNVDAALGAWETANATEARRRWRWAFVGDIDLDVAERLRRRGCLVTGAVEDVRPFYERARCVLVPALTGRGVKTTSLQAWAMGRPLVVSPVGGQGLPVSPGENALVGGDLKAMVERVQEVLDDPVLAQRLAENGRRTVERELDLSVIAGAFAHLCLDVAARRSAR
ncbi:MAG: glycosyltransferase family 4 protein [Solirubrobacteraceae bacterium]